jgi:hypothetical protein
VAARGRSPPQVEEVAKAVAEARGVLGELGDQATALEWSCCWNAEELRYKIQRDVAAHCKASPPWMSEGRPGTDVIWLLLVW